MKILVIGGSYFYGRVFVMEAAKEHEITVVNRGTYSMEEFGAKQLTGDRRDQALWLNLEEDYEVIVDFCGYESGDVEKVLENYSGQVKQYIFISTVDVYRRGIGGRKAENTVFETRTIPGEAGAYIAGKVALEQEVAEVCKKKNINYTILRPAILYGPYNYAPRESVYIQMAVQNHVLPRLTGADGRFQFTYVKDAAEAIGKCLLNEQTFGQSYNLCGEEILTYEEFFQCLIQAAEETIERINLTVEEAAQHNLPLPFPVGDSETELYSNEKSKEELGVSYTSFSEGMKRTYRAFRNVYLPSIRLDRSDECFKTI